MQCHVLHNIIIFADIKLKSWQREVVGTTIMFSSVLNLHQPKNQLPDKGIAIYCIAGKFGWN